MPRPEKAKTGQDYARIKRKLSASSFQQENNAAFDALIDLIDASINSQGFIDNEFPLLDGSRSSLYNAVKEIQEELQNRNNSKYSISLTNKEVQTIPTGVKTTVIFDTVIFDDGLMWAHNNLDPDKQNSHNIILNANAQWLIIVRCKFSTPET